MMQLRTIASARTLRIETHQQRRSFELFRIATAAAWSAVLSSWTYLQLIWLYAASVDLTDSMIAFSVITITVTPLWYATFLPALAFGVAWYVWLCQAPEAAPTRIRSGSIRLASLQRVGLLCTASCWLAVNYRILPIFPFSGYSIDSAHELLLEAHYGDVPPLIPPHQLELHAFIGALAVGVVALQAWGLVGRLGGRRSSVALLLVSFLVAAIAADQSGFLERGALRMVSGGNEVPAATPEFKGLVLGDPRHRDDARRLIETYWNTHSDSGEVIPHRQVWRSWRPQWADVDRSELRHLYCELCLLPGAPVWTATGIPVRLHEDEPRDEGPTRVVEVPRHPDRVRLYAPGGAASMVVVPMSELRAALDGSDWVVGKLDSELSMSDVHRLLVDLRDAGVRRVDLAVIPYGFHVLPAQAPLLVIDGSASRALFEPREIPRKRDNVIVVKRYVRPDADPRPTCSDTYPYKNERWEQYFAEMPGALPAEIRIPVTPSTKYGEFIAVLGAAITSAPRTIEVPLVEG